MNESCITMYKCRYTHYSEIGGGLNMANISSVTRRDIFDLFEYGIDASWDIFEDTIYYPYYGRFDIFEFLKRLYDLKTLESKDFRFDNAEDEILMHTRNGDYSECWIFDDERFQLRDGDDSILLKFLCEVFHPEVRDDKKTGNFFLIRSMNCCMKMAMNYLFQISYQVEKSLIGDYMIRKMMFLYHFR